jgi:hypothetical protein
MIDPQAIASTCHYVGFCALKTSDQAAWASAIGSILAAVVALGIALSGGVGRLWQRREDGRMLAAFLANEVFTVYHTLGKAIEYIERFSTTGDGALANELSAFARDVSADLMAPVMESKFDKFGNLPSDIGEELAGAIGSLGMCRRGIDKFSTELRSTEPAKWSGLIEPILAQLRQTRANMERAKDFCRRVGSDL